jgi:AcrR family transcriptional regulator
MLDTPNRDRIAERRKATRLEILDAAWTLARERGLAEVTLREVAARVGMRAPSLYFHFDSKNAIYDAMFEQAWSEYYSSMVADMATLPESPRAAIKRMGWHFFHFAVTDLPRHQLMNLRMIPGFEPSPEAYAPSLRVMEDFRVQMTGLGVTDEGAIDIYLALVGGFVNAQQANDPDGDRWARQFDRGLDMYADYVGFPPDDRSNS